jgi:hypothetical protein
MLVEALLEGSCLLSRVAFWIANATSNKRRVTTKALWMSFECLEPGMLIGRMVT